MVGPLVETETLVATETLEETETWETTEILEVTETWVATETLEEMAETLVATTEILETTGIWEAEATGTMAVETSKVEVGAVVAAEACRPKEAVTGLREDRTGTGLKEASTAKEEAATRAETRDLAATKVVMMITTKEATRVLETTTSMMILTTEMATSTMEVSKGMVTRLLDHCKPTSFHPITSLGSISHRL